MLYKCVRHTIPLNLKKVMKKETETKETNPMHHKHIMIPIYTEVLVHFFPRATDQKERRWLGHYHFADEYAPKDRCIRKERI